LPTARLSCALRLAQHIAENSVPALQGNAANELAGDSVSVGNPESVQQQQEA
jgi:hypothetical protein